MNMYADWKGWDELPQTKEGRCTDGFLHVLHDLIRHHKCQNILEIGFNGGHSACCFLNANPSAKMYTFDICRWGIEETAHSILRKYFDITLIKGNSVETIPNFFKNNDILFDLVLVDGCHDYDVALEDIKNTMHHLNDNGFLIVDDIHMGGVYLAMMKSELNKIYDSRVIEVKFENHDGKTIIRPFVIFKKGTI